MACDVKVYKGRNLAIAIRNDGDTAWELLGGVASATVSFANNTVDVTSQSTVGDYSEKQFNGFSDLTVSGNYFADATSGQVDPNTGYTVVSSQRLIDVQNNPERCGKFQIIDPDFIIEGEFTLASFERTGEIKGVIQGSLSLESRNSVTLTNV